MKQKQEKGGETLVVVIKFSYLCADEQKRETRKTIPNTTQGLYL